VPLPPAPSSLKKRARASTHPEPAAPVLLPSAQPVSAVAEEVAQAMADELTGGSSSGVFEPEPEDAAAQSGLGGALPIVTTSSLLDLQPTTLAEQADAAAAAAAAAAAPPAAKKQRAETKQEKERRLNRVGLSYRCGRCGQPKKGHVCNGEGEEGAEGGSGNGSGASGAAGAGAGGWALDSESIFKDIKSVLQTPSCVDAVTGSGVKGKSKSGGKASGSKRRKGSRGDEGMPPPGGAPMVHAAVVSAEKSALLEELDFAMQRPPSVITPDDGDTARTGGPASLAPAPSSLVSASDMFSPGQLMTHLLGTPTPAITPGLSPGTLNELGNMLQSPGAVLASARKASETTTDTSDAPDFGTEAPKSGESQPTQVAVGDEIAA
jgi:hypothetical protein